GLGGQRGRQRPRGPGARPRGAPGAGAARPDDAGDGRLRIPRGPARRRRDAAGGGAHRQGAVARRTGAPCRPRAERAREGQLQPVPARAGSAARDRGAGGGGGVSAMKILLVEDNEMNRDMLSRRLLRRGYELVFAMDGQEAVDKARSEAPSLILMDMGLPVIDGWEATRRIKADPATAAIPVIALTAHAMAADRDKCLAAGCDDFDTKPVDIARLVGKI